MIFGFEVMVFDLWLSVIIIMKILFFESNLWLCSMMLLILLIFKLLIKVLLEYMWLLVVILLFLYFKILFLFMINIFDFVILILWVNLVWLINMWYFLWIGIKYFGFNKLIINFKFFWFVWLEMNRLLFIVSIFVFVL